MLTCKEVKILEAIVGGHTNQDIADKIFLSPHTVKTHIYNLYKKIGVTNRVQAVNWARKHLKNERED
jgi:LuxR family transcriptional regulator of csgAB operon